MKNEYTNETRPLPLWREWILQNEARINFGATFTTEELSGYLGLNPDDAEFAFAVLEIRRALRHRGMNFTARGGWGESYSITPPAKNVKELKRMQASAVSAMVQGVILGANTPVDLLTADEARRHEAELERISTRLALMSRKSINGAVREARKAAEARLLTEARA